MIGLAFPFAFVTKNTGDMNGPFLVSHIMFASSIDFIILVISGDEDDFRLFREDFVDRKILIPSLILLKILPRGNSELNSFIEDFGSMNFS